MSFSFKKVCKFKAGEQYWENSQYGCIRFTIKDEPTVTEEKVSFIGVTPEGEEVEYLLVKGFEHYGPKISNIREYYTTDEINTYLASAQ